MAACVYLFVCLHHNSKSYGQMLVIFFSEMSPMAQGIDYLILVVVWIIIWIQEF